MRGSVGQTIRRDSSACFEFHTVARGSLHQCIIYERISQTVSPGRQILNPASCRDQEANEFLEGSLLKELEGIPALSIGRGSCFLTRCELRAVRILPTPSLTEYDRPLTHPE